MYASAEATRPLGVKTIVSLNPIMVDGTGMCGACRCTADGRTKFACVDGPDFDGHQVDWAELFMRRKSYFDDEIRSLCRYEEEELP
jgi:ferredoxin--NADP+ reductase